MHSLLQDLRHAFRLLAKNPGFTAVAVVVLALGIGANTAVFSIVNILVLKPIPTDGSDVVGIFAKDRTRPDQYRAFSWADYQAVRGARELFDNVLAHTMSMVGISEGERTRRSFVGVVSANYFSTLGVQLAAGREFTADEERPGANQLVVIGGFQLARKAGATPAEMIGRTLRINAREYTIVGMAPEGFSGTTALVSPEVWLPLGAYERVSDEMFRDGQDASLANPKTRPLMLIGRLRRGIAADAAAPMLATVTAWLARADPAENANFELMVTHLPRLSISTSPRSEDGTGVLTALLMGMAAMVLLIACLNLANMLLARGTARRKEIALRLALGSGRGRVVRQLLTESLLIALAGGAAGLLLAATGTKALVSTLGAALPMTITFDASPDVRVLAATFGFCVFSTILAGLGPAWRVTRQDVLPDLKEQPAEHGAGRRISVRNLLVVGQIALSLALLTAAGLFMRGAMKAAVADPGFPLEGGIVAGIDPALVGYDEARSRGAILNILQRVRAVPGVQSASMASLVPFGEFQEGNLVQKAGTPPAPEGQRETGVSATYTIVAADYFETMRMPIIRGRGFTPAEEAAPGGPAIAVVDEPLARQLFGGGDAIGERVQFARGRSQAPKEYTIVGIVAGIRHDMFDKVPVAHLYVPFGQNARSRMNLHVRISNPGPAAEAAMLGTLRQEIRAADAQVPVTDLETLTQHRDGSVMLWAVNTGARLFAIFGAVALLLAVVGVYGVKAYVVSRRTREIGIRMALGATPGNVMWLVLREGMTLTAFGLGAGLVLAGLTGRLLSGMLYEVSPIDPLVFAGAPLVLAAAALTASYLPARKATKVLPLTALRTD